MIDLNPRETIQGVIDSILGWQSLAAPLKDHLRFWFRGQAKSSWDLKPKLYRVFANSGDETILYSERHMVRDFRLMSAGIRRGDESNEQLYFLEQHYGMPTRLLDWTTNPLIALYFACASLVHDGVEQDGRFFMLDAATATKTFQQDGNLFGIATDQRPEFQRWMDHIVGWNDGITDLFCESFPIRPAHFDRRITLQQGVFTFHVPNEKSFDRPEITTFVIPAAKKIEMLSQLRTLNIHSFSIFGDLPNLSIYLQEAYELWTKLG